MSQGVQIEAEVRAGLARDRQAAWPLASSPRTILLVAWGAALWQLWRFRSPAVCLVRFAQFDALLNGVLICGALVIGRVVQLHLQRRMETRQALEPGSLQRVSRFWPSLLGCAAFTILAIGTDLPMRLAFFASQRALNQIADEALGNPMNANALAGRWVGFYWIADVKVNGSTVILMLDKDRDFGFIRAPRARGMTIRNPEPAADDSGFFAEMPADDLIAADRIAGDWFVMYSIYWRLKYGWS